MRAGGLGLRSIREMNTALQGKWLWRFNREEGKLWRRVVLARWGETGGGYAQIGRSRPHGLSMWRKIREEYNKFVECLNWKLGSGDRIRFWDDNWMGDSNLKDRFPSIFAIATNKRAYVNELFMRSGTGGDWCVQVGRNLQDWEVEEYCNLLNLLAGLSLGNGKDERIWKLSKVRGLGRLAVFRINKSGD